MLVERSYPEEVSLDLPEPEFGEDGLTFVITSRSLAPCEEVAATPDPFRALLERGEINEWRYRGLLYVIEHGAIHRLWRVAIASLRLDDRVTISIRGARYGFTSLPAGPSAIPDWSLSGASAT